MAEGHVDKRQVQTDALATLGKIHQSNEKRDAIHLAVEPVVAGENLKPGDHIGFLSTMSGASNIVGNRAVKHLGIVDPFLRKDITRGDKFWMIVYPRQITSLRHVWSHPDFGEELSQEDRDKITKVENVLGGEAQRRIENFATSLSVTFDDIIEGARAWVEEEEYMCGGNEFMNAESYDGFWDDYESVTGHVVKKDKQMSDWFSCSC